MKLRPADLLYHDAPMVLLDELVDSDPASVVAAVTVHSDSQFCESGLGVPAHVGIEWMAQTCGLFSGLEAKSAGRPVRLGFLLGTRRYRALRGWFAIGDRALVTARLVFREGGMAVFDCTIAVDGNEAAVAQLTLYQPEDQQADVSPQVME